MVGPQRTTPSRARRQDTTPYNHLPPAPLAAAPTAVASDAALSDDNSSSIPTVARQITRMVAMFWSPRTALNAYPDLQEAIEDGSEATLRAAASPAEKRYYDICDELERIQPDFFEQLGAMGSDCRRQVRKELSDGQSGAKAEDNNKVKNGIVHWRKWSPALVNEPKTIRGLFHPECARLLAPITVDFDNEEERRQFTECDNPPMTSSHWPRALYLDDEGDPAQPSKGLLQGDLLYKASFDEPNAAKQGRKGIAHKYQLGVITPAFLAYAAVVLRFSLSSEAHFNDTGGTFNYVDFYNQIRCYLESPKYEKTNKILLAWWNKKVFPNSIQTHNNAMGDEPSGMLSLLDAEIEREQSDSGGFEDEE
ncbi:unnamed protein product [Rhizoctonia solani]|uniref:Uncharacterized protein n=1 Tax=Rhizoctonia solani TaxID=456999 RepID=A0A8H2WCV2_9AGAM|nr:unnamed protein product [Rhizoctonia solani]